jgi:DNA-binding transcriptional ArsR family regulator
VAEVRLPEIRIDKQLFSLLSNHRRLEVFVFLIEQRASPKDIADKLGKRVNDVSYDIKELLKMKLIELVKEEPRRGQLAHIYRAVLRPVWSNEEWGRLSQDDRERYASWAAQLFLHDIALAWAGRTFQARVEAHTSRGLYSVDEQGWRDLNRIQDEALAASREVEVESDQRLKVAGDKSKTITVRAGMFCFEMPASTKRLKPTKRSK